MASVGNEIPSELRRKLSSFDQALTDIETKLEPFMKKTQVEINAEVNTLDKAKLDLVSAYTINSLFWMYLNVCGINPKEHGIKSELDRIRSYMNRVKDIQEAEKAKEAKAALNVKAAKRFVKSALWEAAKKNVGPESNDPKTQGESTMTGMIQEVIKNHPQGEKRKSECTDETEEGSKKKNKKKKKKNKQQDT